MKYKIQQIFAVVDQDDSIVDFRDTEEEAESVARAMEQDDADRAAIEFAFGN